MDGVAEGPLLLLVTFHCLLIAFPLDRRVVKFEDAVLAILKNWPRRQLFLTLSPPPRCLRHKSGLPRGTQVVYG